MTVERKETVQYITAICTLASGVIMCFLSFFLNKYVVHDSALWYFGETLAFAGSVFGIGIYVNHQIKKAELNIHNDVDRKLESVNRLFKTET